MNHKKRHFTTDYSIKSSIPFISDYIPKNPMDPRSTTFTVRSMNFTVRSTTFTVRSVKFYRTVREFYRTVQRGPYGDPRWSMVVQHGPYGNPWWSILVHDGPSWSTWWTIVVHTVVHRGPWTSGKSLWTFCGPLVFWPWWTFDLWRYWWVGHQVRPPKTQVIIIKNHLQFSIVD